MTKRRDTSHVRPRPPSYGRAIQPVKVAAPDRRRVRQRRGLDARRPRAPLAMRRLLVLGVVVLGAGASLVASGGVGPALASITGGLGSALNRLAATSVPTATELAATNAPRVEPPGPPHTHKQQVHPSASRPPEAPRDPPAHV